MSMAWTLGAVLVFNVAFLALTFAVASSAADDLGDSATGKFYALST